jgi:hypothetical protein
VLPTVIGVAGDREDGHGQVLGDATCVPRGEDRHRVPALLNPVRNIHTVPLQTAAGKQIHDRECKMHDAKINLQK